MKKLLNKIGVDLANKIINKFPISAPRNALFYYINKGKERGKKKKRVVLDSVTVLDDNKALLTYKSDKSYYTKKIDYRRRN